jgi:hypothetical protein
VFLVENQRTPNHFKEGNESNEEQQLALPGFPVWPWTLDAKYQRRFVIFCKTSG